MPHPGVCRLSVSKLLRPELWYSCGTFHTSAPVNGLASLGERTPAHCMEKRGTQYHTGCGHLWMTNSMVDSATGSMERMKELKDKRCDLKSPTDVRGGSKESTPAMEATGKLPTRRRNVTSSAQAANLDLKGFPARVERATTDIRLYKVIQHSEVSPYVHLRWLTKNVQQCSNFWPRSMKPRTYVPILPSLL